MVSARFSEYRRVLCFATVCSMRFSSLLLVLILTVRTGFSQEQATEGSCQKNIRLFYNAPPISTLSTKERAGVIDVLFPELKASEASMGFDTRELTPERLSSMLRFKELATEARGERVLAVTYQDPVECGNHGQCPAYLLAIGQGGVTSLVTKNGHFDISVGGTWGVAVMPRNDSPYPDLLFLATISSSEIAVACYRWGGHAYSSGCDVPCARVLAHPYQQ